MTWAAFCRGAYQAARGWGIQPAEFWAMSLWEWWAEFDAKIEEQKAMKGATAKWSPEELERVRRR